MITKLTKPQAPMMLDKFNFAALLPQFNVAALLPRYDVAASALGRVDVTSFLPRLGYPAFSDLLESLRKDEPPNWDGVDIDIDLVTAIVSDDGIPLVWVPRPAIVEALLQAPDRDARVAVLLTHVEDLTEDCHSVLDDVDDATLVGQKPLAVAAVTALAKGHHEAAQALAVSVTETAVSRSLGRKYTKVKEQVLFDPDLVPWTQLRLRAALAPIYPFYTDWWPSQGEPPLEKLSRHVSVHHADVSRLFGSDGGKFSLTSSSSVGSARDGCHQQRAGS
ncbi:hypothetical protein AB2L27_19855 [Kineococcus sp. LSe6-4]|uniref:Uncharacterized protein n=1 Tax=Kineococcus halophytocola TaxID=3234027 RepID=A0ABV4H9A6_9ACTN